MFTKSVDGVMKVFTKALADLEAVEAEQTSINQRALAEAQASALEIRRAAHIQLKLKELLA